MYGTCGRIDNKADFDFDFLTLTLTLKSQWHFCGFFSVVSLDLMMFLKEVSYAHQGCIYVIKNTVKTVKCYEILLQFKITVFYLNIF